jgi:ABC-2 type transport system permease protein
VFKQITAMTWKELKIYLRDPAIWAWMFLQPFILIVVLSFAMGGPPGQDEQAQTVKALVVNEDRGDRAAAIVLWLQDAGALAAEETWEGQPLNRGLAEQLVADGERTLALIFPPSFSEALVAEPGSSETVVVAIEDPEPSTQSTEPVLITLQSLIEREALAAQIPKANATSTIVVKRTAPTGMEARPTPNPFQQNVSGVTIYGIFWIVSLLAGSVYQEKREGTFRRLLVAPMRRSVLLAGKLLPYYLINLMQIAAMLGLAALLFQVSLGRSPAGLIAVSLLASATATGLGVLVAAIARTEAQVGAISTILLLVLAVLGGCFIPRWVMPDWLRSIGLATPHAWAVDAFQVLMVQGGGLRDVLPAVAALAAFAVLFFTLGVWRFRFDS